MKTQRRPHCTALPPNFITSVRLHRRRRTLHGAVTQALVKSVGRLFPGWVCMSEVLQTPGGRNDAVLFNADGTTVCFELFGSSSQVDRDLLLLRDSTAQRKVAILVDREVDPRVAAAYYRKRPHEPYPAILVSDLLLAERAHLLNLKLAGYVLGYRLAQSLLVANELFKSAHTRILTRWASRGIKIYAGPPGIPSAFIDVVTLLAIRRLVALGVPLHACEGAARVVNEDYQFLMHQILIGVPMILIHTAQDDSIMDYSDYQCWLGGSILQKDYDHVSVLLNPVYGDLRAAYRGQLPEPRSMEDMLHVMSLPN